MIDIVANQKQQIQALEKELGKRDETICEKEAHIRYLEFQVKSLNAQIYGQKADRREKPEDSNQEQLPFQEHLDSKNPEPRETSKRSNSSNRTGKKKGPKSFPAHLPRREVEIEDPDLKDLICPVTGKPMKPAFQDRREVLNVIPAQYEVVVYKRNVFVSSAQEAPVFAPWPANILPNSRVDISIVADVVHKKFALHQPYNRQSDELKALGLSIAPNTLQSWCQKLGDLIEPLDEAILSRNIKSGYIQLDGTSLKLLDPKRPGKAQSCNLWAYRALDGPVYFQFAKTKEGALPENTLKNFKGILQTDGANNFGGATAATGVTHLGCWAHLRRYFVDAENLGESRSSPFVDKINKVFRLERLARFFGLSKQKWQRLRTGHSVPLWEQLKQEALQFCVERAKTHKLPLEKACNYLLNHQKQFEQCLLTQGSRIDNNLVEGAIGPLKIGAKNWLFLGHPNAGPFNTRLFNIVQNCRLAKVNVVEYLTDLMLRLQDYPASKIEDFIPQNWAKLSKS